MNDTPIAASTEGLTIPDFTAIGRSLAAAVIAANGTVLRANSLFLDLFGFDASDLIGHHRRLLVSDDHRADDEPLRSVFEAGASFEGDLQLTKHDGSVFWAYAIVGPAEGSNDHPRDVVLLLNDITERKRREAEMAAQVTAINTSQAVVHFDVDGTIVDANPTFLSITGYDRSDVIGRHHSLFLDETEAAGIDYAEFWKRLCSGQHESGEFRRFGKDGRSVWFRATYNPIFDIDGKLFKIVKYAVDVTTDKLQQMDHEGQIDAIHKSQCVVTFNLDGTIIDANENFLNALGYRLDEIDGRHHRLFVDPSYAHSLEYDTFWSDLSEGKHRSGEFRRIGKNGQEHWLQATYNPVFDHSGKPFKIVKFATIMTREKRRQADHQGQIAALHKSQSVVSFALDGTILDANDRFLELTGYRLSDVRLRHHSMFVSPGEASGEAYGSFWSKLALGEHQTGEFKRIGRDGREIWIQASYNPIFDAGGKPFKVVKNAVDITTEKLRLSDYEGQIDAIRKSQGVVTFDMDGTILDANENFLQSAGYGLSEFAGRNHRLLVDEAETESPQYAAFWEALRNGQFLMGKYRRIGKDGREIWIQASYNPILDLNGEPFKIVEIATDITNDVAIAANLTKAQQEIRLDALTQLPNRLGLSDFMHEWAEGATRELTVFYLDLDHFKPINDTFGHHVGDHVLKELSGRMRSALLPDQIVARVGGDEFVVAALDLSTAQAAGLAQCLIDLVGKPIEHDESSLTVGLSIGIAQASSGARDIDALLRDADVALYRTKGGQRGTYTFVSAEPGDTRTDAERHMAHEMQYAIKADQFALSFKPRFIAENRLLQAVEVQAEWNHPERGRLLPADFLPTAEQSGLIVKLGKWLMTEACRQAADWALITVSVPVSHVQMTASDLPETVKHVLGETGMDANRLELRLIGFSARSQELKIKDDLKVLRDLGVSIVLDESLANENVFDPGTDQSFDAIRISNRALIDFEERCPGSAPDIRRLEEVLDLDDLSSQSLDDLADILVLRLDRNFRLEAFLSADARSAEDMTGLVETAKKSA